MTSSSSSSFRKRRAPETLVQPTIDKFTQKFVSNQPISSIESPETSMKSYARSQPKKLVFKSFKVKPRLPENFASETWSKLQNAIHAIFESKPVFDSLEVLYRCCEDMCHHKLYDTLNTNIKNECQKHIDSVARDIIQLDLSPEHYLIHFNDIWIKYCGQLLLIRSIFLYFDRTYLVVTTNSVSLWDLGLQLFRQSIIMNPLIQKKLISSLLTIIDNDRCGFQVSKPAINSIVKMFVSCGCYFSLLESDYFESCRKFYQKEASDLLNALELEPSANALKGYMQNVELRLQQESVRCSNAGYLDVGSLGNSLKIVQHELIESNFERILKCGFSQLIETSASDLKTLYKLCSHSSDCLCTLKQFFSDFIKSQVSDIVLNEANDAEKDNSMIQSLIQAKNNLGEILINQFENNELLLKALKDSMEESINKRSNKPAELIAKYIDSLMKNTRNLSESEIDSNLDHCLGLFRFVHGKDVFEAFYKKQLSKRLLLGKSSSIDMEKSMLSRMKTECGSQFTSHLERMFKDIDLSKELSKSFKDSKFKAAVGKMDMYINVLTFGSWPPFPNEESLILPELFVKYQQAFHFFYTSKHHKRSLKWQYALGSCQVKAKFPKGDKELDVSLFQTMVLLLFNNSESLDFTKIQQETGISEAELIRTLQSLACGKIKVLSKEPKSKTISATDIFTVDSEFTSQQFRVKINSIQLKETVQEQKDTEERVFLDRQHQVDAAIVRVLKARRTATHLALVNEVLSILKFQMTAADFKKRIESLIEREFMSRDVKDPSVYHYIA